MSSIPLSAADRQRRDNALRLVQCFDNSGVQMDPHDWAAKLRMDYEHSQMAAEDRFASLWRDAQNVYGEAADAHNQLRDEMSAIWEELPSAGEGEMLQSVIRAGAVPEESRTESQRMLLQAWSQFGSISRIVSNWV